MIVTIVTETYSPDVNGVAMTLGRLTSGLSEAGHLVQLVCTSSKKRTQLDLPDNITYYPVYGVPIPRYNEARFGLPSRNILKELWNKRRPDVIYVATEGPLGWSAIKLANEFSIPTISGFHTNFHSYSKHYGVGIIEKIVERYLISLHNKSGLTLTPTKQQKDKLIKMGIKNVSVLGRGVDAALFSPRKRSLSLRKNWGACFDHEPVMLYVGRIAAEKNLELAVKTYHAMYEKNNKLKFVLVGGGPLRNKLQIENPNFIFAGVKTGEELAMYYASSDVFIFPSMSETFGNVVLEAMASGLGVIGYDYAAANMHIKHGINGMLANFDDAYDFIQNASEYMNNDVLLTGVKLAASEHALKHRWYDVVNEFESLLSFSAFKAFNNYILDEDLSNVLDITN